MFVNNLINSNRSCALVVPRMLRYISDPDKQFLLRVAKQYLNDQRFDDFEIRMGSNIGGLVKPSQRLIDSMSYQFDLMEMEFRNK